MSRLVPYRTKVSEEVAASIQQTLSTTMYLVQTTGPTSYVIQEQNCNKKHKVLIGSLQSCSCGTADICIHILFVMLKVLRVPATTPVVWQKSLIDSEIETLLRGGYREQLRPAPKPFMKRKKEEAAAKAAQPEDADVERHELVEGEVCAICQEDMDDNQPLTFCRKG
ncbi:E3 ubiquitin-protein ligase Zswim2 [Phytophthora cinnamomi]|uniref:E3 ubiquitin-protein ligase Zswim2 n=1 Tax=Phytophthora cinnamomi TaxID=4785 RepID=UPI0035596AA5|nr:E3 ubiquitin-protein ligase Zswim2 [Phytophthora cinnamomi]